MDIFLIIFEIISAFIGYKPKPSLSVDNIDDDPVNLRGGLSFLIENVSDTLTMLQPVVSYSFVNQIGERCSVIFDVDDTDLSLPAFTPKKLQASARTLQPERLCGKNKCYQFIYGDGKTVEIKVA
ncbi:hypothetical protein JCM14076_19920 [Methylosoma difficile]